MNSSKNPETPRDFYRPHKRVQYTGELVNHKTGEFYTPERRVKQSFVAECDINTIMKQYSQTGQLKHISANAQKGAYLDLPDEIDFQQSLAIVAQAEASFASLPSKTRDRFSNDPAKFLEFLSNPENRDEAIKLGLVTAPANPTTNTTNNTDPSNAQNQNLSTTTTNSQLSISPNSQPKA